MEALINHEERVLGMDLDGDGDIGLPGHRWRHVARAEFRTGLDLNGNGLLG